VSGDGKIKVMDATNGDNIVDLSSVAGLNGSDDGPVWSPDGTRIAFYSSRNTFHYEDEIWVMNSDGSLGNPARLTFDSWNDYAPTWSTDGSKIAFRTVRDGNHEIYVLDANSSSGDSTNITNNNAFDGAPSWSR
jgi:Tol biopolymer transport system component